MRVHTQYFILIATSHGGLSDFVYPFICTNIVLQHSQ